MNYFELILNELILLFCIRWMLTKTSAHSIVLVSLELWWLAHMYKPLSSRVALTTRREDLTVVRFFPPLGVAFKTIFSDRTLLP